MNKPYNAAGKVDVSLITKGYVNGKTYAVESVCKDGRLTDIVFEAKQGEAEDCGMTLCILFFVSL